MDNVVIAAISPLAPAAASPMALQQQTIAEPSYLVAAVLRLVTWAPGPFSALTS